MSSLMEDQIPEFLRERAGVTGGDARVQRTPSVDDERRTGDGGRAQKDGKIDIPVDWTFKNRSVADNFDRHVREQLPWYDYATGIVAHFGRHYLPQKDGVMYDFGASTGNCTKVLEKEIKARGVRAISLDNSPQMADVWRGVGEFKVADVLEERIEPFDFGVCFLLMMFLPPTEQRPFLEGLMKKVKIGGCLIFFDKIAPYNGYLGTVCHRLTLAGKVATGCSAEEIIQKELSLAGAQRPIDAKHLLLVHHGIQEVFRFGEFAGWVYSPE